MLNLKNSAVVITGASSGVGRAAAIAFAERGSALMLSSRGKEALEDVADQCRERGSDAHVFAADVTSDVAMQNLAREAVRRFGRIDVWINNASVSAYGRVEDIPVEWWHRVVEVNLMGYFHGTRAALPWFREQGRGTFINVGSILDTTVVPYQSAYVAAKHGVRALSESVRQESRDVPGIRVCLVSPGPIDTPFFEAAGNASGRRVEPPLRTTTPERVASTLVRIARRPRDQHSVGVDTQVARVLDRLAPGPTRRAMTFMGEHDQFDADAHEDTEGSLFAPRDAANARIEGGWRSGDTKHRRRARAARLGAASIALAATVTAVAFTATRGTRR